MEKSGMLFFLAAAVCAMSASAFAGTVTYLSNIQVKNETYYTPFPAEPGKYFDFYLSIRNTGKEPVSAECSLVPAYPFSLDPGEQNTRVFYDFGENKEALLKYRIRVDDNAVEGDNDFGITCTDLGRRISSTASFSVYVQAKASTVNIQGVKIEPPNIGPGQSGRLTVSVRSESPNYLKDFKIRLEVSPESFPIAVVNGTNERLVSQVSPYQSLDFPFEIVSYPSAQSGVYKLPLTVTYSDKLGKSYSINQTTGISIATKPVVEVSAESTEIATVGQTGKILLRVMNRGLSGIKLLTVRLLESPNQYAILSTPVQYVGSVSSDDYETAEFKVHVSQNATRPLPVLAEISYADSSNAQYSQKVAALLPVFSKSEALSYGLEKVPDNTLLYGAAGMIALYIFFKYAMPALGSMFGALLSFLRRERQARKP